MILTKEEILQAVQIDKTIIIEPFLPELVSINSVDIRLGSNLWKLKQDQEIRDLYCPDDDLWIEQSPVTTKSIRERNPNFAKDILDDEDLCFIFEGNCFYLATTLECIGTAKQKPCRRPVVAEMKAKSTIGRQGLTVALCAGMGDIGYQGRWALEVRVTDNGSVPIAIGTPIAQAVFHETTRTKQFYDGKSRYQDGKKVRFLPKPLKFKTEWKS